MSRISVLKLGAVAAIAAFAFTGKAGAVDASSCTDTSGYSYTECSSSSNSNKDGTTVIGSATLAASSGITSGLVGSRIATLLGDASHSGNQMMAALGTGSGINSGSTDPRFGVWINGDWSRVVGTKAGAGFNGNVWSGMLGADYAVTDRLTAGLAFGYENLDVDTKFNGGTLEDDGFTVAPYALFQINDTFSVDGSFGFSWLDYDTKRIDSIGTRATITGSTDSKRWFGSVNGNGAWTNGAINLGANLGIMYVRENVDGFTESNATVIAAQHIDLGRAILGGRVGYTYKMVEPYARGEMQYDYAKESGAYDDKFGAKFGLGINLDLPNNVSGNIEATTDLFRSDLTTYGVNGTLRVAF